MGATTTTPFKFNENNVIEQTVKNERLKTDLGYHIVNPNFTVDMNKKLAQGQVHCYKSGKLIDAVNEGSTPQPSNVVNFAVPFTDFADLDKQVLEFAKTNIEKIAAA